jgi:hypothetical protein
MIKLIGIIICFLLSSGLNSVSAKERFSDSFDGGLSGWDLVGADSIEIINSNDPDHGQVMKLQPNGEVYPLIKNSEKWDPVRIEGEVLFPNDGDNYLGLIYNYSDNLRRDFGSIYIKGNESYLMVNPWRDGNASRLLYEEYRTSLSGEDAIHVNRWQKFMAEVQGNVCHFYVNNTRTPKIVFGLLELSSGMIGFKPRIVGTEVWIDNIRVSSIEKLSYQGEKIPKIQYEPQMLLNDWQVIGPFPKPDETIEHSKSTFKWKPFNVDARGAVITGRITEYRGEKSIAYFRTVVKSSSEKNVILHITTTDELALFLNGRFLSFIYRDGYMSGKNDWNAWFDFWKNPEHAGRKIPLSLNAGENQIVLRARNGQFASGGFFARIEDQ